jgi:ribosomal protein S18 acetylase RimI-like enzyme
MLSGTDDVFYRLSALRVVTNFVPPQKLDVTLVDGPGGLMEFEWRPVIDRDLDFARDLTCSNMLGYYIQHDLLWQDEAFDVAWAGRDNRLILRGECPVGYVSLSRDARALYIRELHVSEAFRGQGGGSWVIDQAFALACKERRPALRLTVFQNNPARALYERKGLKVVGTDDCFLRMQRDVDGLHR